MNGLNLVLPIGVDLQRSDRPYAEVPLLSPLRTSVDRNNHLLVDLVASQNDTISTFPVADQKVDLCFQSKC